MPTYEYRCADCGHEFTTVLSISEHDKGKTQCPKCRSEHVQQTVSAVFVKTSRKSVTNNHVVEGADEIDVTFWDGSVATARLIGADPYSDLALIKVTVESARLAPLSLGDFDQVRVGQRVIAIGNPFGLVGTMTVGIVSGKGRTLPADVSTGGAATSPIRISFKPMRPLIPATPAGPC